MLKKKIKNIEFKPEDALLNRNSDFAMVEAYKSMRTNIMYSMPKTDYGKVIVITSSAAGEGKTTTCINLAMTFAQVNAKVLLIDCDLRRPKIHRYMKLERKDGISNVLCGFADLERAIKTNVRENLDILTSGDVPPNPAELLQTVEFERVMNYLKRKYDYIIVDTPPVNAVTDATLVIKYSEGAIILVKKNYTTYEMLDEAVDKLRKVNSNIIGTIMIDSKENDNSSSYYKKSKYGYSSREERYPRSKK